MQKAIQIPKNLEDLHADMAREINAILKDSIHLFCEDDDLDCMVHLDLDAVLKASVRELSSPRMVVREPNHAVEQELWAKQYNSNFHVVSMESKPLGLFARLRSAW